MAGFVVSAIAGQRLDEIFVYTRDTWGEAQAEAYLRGLFDCFEAIVRRERAWRAIPKEFGAEGYYCRHDHHYVYWRLLAGGTIGIVTILHEQMHLMDRFRDDSPA